MYYRIIDIECPFGLVPHIASEADENICVAVHHHLRRQHLGRAKWCDNERYLFPVHKIAFWIIILMAHDKNQCGPYLHGPESLRSFSRIQANGSRRENPKSRTVFQGVKSILRFVDNPLFLNDSGK